MVGGDFIPRGIWLEQVAMVQGRLIAIDWHQVTDVCRYSGRRHVQAADNGQVPADVAAFYNIRSIEGYAQVIARSFSVIPRGVQTTCDGS